MLMHANFLLALEYSFDDSWNEIFSHCFAIQFTLAQNLDIKYCYLGG